MSQDFSDAPFKVDGVTVKPTWPWSSAYRASVVEELRRATKGDLLPEELRRRYVAWYAAKNDLTLAEARSKIEESK